MFSVLAQCAARLNQELDSLEARLDRLERSILSAPCSGPIRPEPLPDDAALHGAERP